MERRQPLPFAYSLDIFLVKYGALHFAPNACLVEYVYLKPNDNDSSLLSLSFFLFLNVWRSGGDFALCEFMASI